LHYLYIDESGDDDDYLDSSGKQIKNRSKFFTLGGIIVDAENQRILENHFSWLMADYFNEIMLPANFKLHYHGLRMKLYPYSLLEDTKRWRLADEVFNGIKSTKCYLVSVTINKELHYNTYRNPINPTGYAMYLMLERFQYFLEDHNDVGFAIYERYNSKMRKMVDRVHRWLKSLGTFPTPTNFGNIIHNVKNGDPKTHPILQHADFFAYVPWRRSESCYKATNRYNEIKHKYFNFCHSTYFKRGNVEI
jgi:hypothetical protein